MATNNVWIGTGRLSADVDFRPEENGRTAIASFTLAVDREYHRDGEASADFIRCVCFGKRAEMAHKYYTKGTLIRVVGRISTRSYKDQQTGKNVYVTEVIVDESAFGESKKAAEARKGSAENTNTVASAGAYNGGDEFSNIPDFVEDLPFGR